MKTALGKKVDSVKEFIDLTIEEIKEQAKDGNVLLALSGGVDSSVCALLCDRAIGDKLDCIFINHGLLRQNEFEEVCSAFEDCKFNLHPIDAENRFLTKLTLVTNPESKRKIIGEEFIRVFEDESEKLNRGFKALCQGTIYPDIKESEKGEKLVKSHHNVGGMPSEMSFDTLIEPLKYLYKEDVRAIGKELGLKESIVNRQPFPGPGLAVRVLGDITREKLDILRICDKIYRDELEKAGAHKELSQYFVALLSERAVGIKNGERVYGYQVALRAIKTTDFCTAKACSLSFELLNDIAKKITDEVHDVTRVLYDLTDKPPATIEFE